jgi:hypothetical protein
MLFIVSIIVIVISLPLSKPSLLIRSYIGFAFLEKFGMYGISDRNLEIPLNALHHQRFLGGRTSIGG